MFRQAWGIREGGWESPFTLNLYKIGMHILILSLSVPALRRHAEGRRNTGGPRETRCQLTTRTMHSRVWVWPPTVTETVMVAVPLPSALTAPVALTEATAELLLA